MWLSLKTSNRQLSMQWSRIRSLRSLMVVMWKTGQCILVKNGPTPTSTWPKTKCNKNSSPKSFPNTHHQHNSTSNPNSSPSIAGYIPVPNLKKWLIRLSCLRIRDWCLQGIGWAADRVLGSVGLWEGILWRSSMGVEWKVRASCEVQYKLRKKKLEKILC